ncbi:hypothetical protein B0A54_13174 [Friedmanniomyces endolithicus]|uniref:UEV domain-containing protein n=1 Tax=Friedmanniomyces endolithicus TaxID=329885 RepID=A0A4U0UJE1_9PEZI|nr:hypothetical protein B0A54_13174 [Friedmanniomyces endolithicus]
MAQYHDLQRTYSDAARILAAYPSISPRTEVYAYENGRSALLLTLSGTLPVDFRGTVYRFPVKLWVPQSYPQEPPIVYITPGRDMLVRPGQHVAVDGRVYHPYLRDWQQAWDRASMAQLLDFLQQVFAKEPPVISKAQQQQFHQRPIGQAQSPNTTTGASLLPQRPPKHQGGSVEPVEMPSTSMPPPKPPKPGEEYAGSYPQRTSSRDLTRNGPPLPPLPHERTSSQQYVPSPLPQNGVACISSICIHHTDRHQAPPPPKQPPPDLLSDPFDVALLNPSKSGPPAPAPPIPPNPEREHLHQALSTTLVQQAHTKVSQTLSAISPLQAQQSALRDAHQRLESEIRQLEHLASTLATNESILRASITTCDQLIQSAKTKPQPNVDEVLVAPTMVAQQLWNACAEEAGCREAMYVLQRAVDKGRVEGVDFVKQMRGLGREAFGKMVLARKCARGLGLDVGGRAGSAKRNATLKGHDVASWRGMWEEVGREKGVELEVWGELRKVERLGVKVNAAEVEGEGAMMMVFWVRRLG